MAELRDLVGKMREAAQIKDGECSHGDADEVLCDAIRELARIDGSDGSDDRRTEAEELIALWHSMTKWYA